MNLFHILIPWRLHLTILQQEHYELGRFLKWVLAHFFLRRLPQKKPVTWTMKAKALILSSLVQILALLMLSAFLSLSYAVYGIRHTGLLFWVLSLLFLLNPWIPLTFAQVLLLPAERWQKRRIIATAASKIASFPNVTVIGIAGSYGKTSMKTILAHILRGWKRVLATPLSHNVPMGIAQVVDLELDGHYDFFVVEMGEFYQGDIRELCEMVRPMYGMITGLNSQHSERLGTIEEAGRTLFELQEWLRQQSHLRPSFGGQAANSNQRTASVGIFAPPPPFLKGAGGILGGAVESDSEHVRFAQRKLREEEDETEGKNLNLFVNGNDENIRQYVTAHGLENEVLFYGTNSSSLEEGVSLRASDIRFSEEGTTFNLVIMSEVLSLSKDEARQSPTQIPPAPFDKGGDPAEKAFLIKIPLLGTGQVTNVLGALSIALRLGAPLGHLLKRLSTLPQISHRLEREIWENGLLLVDDAFNSNVDGFRQALDVLAKLPRGNKALVTPGIIELGKETKEIHAELGKAANEACSKVILVGKSERTEGLAQHIAPEKTVWINDINELWDMIPTLCPDPKDSVVLLENDLPESAM